MFIGADFIGDDLVATVLENNTFAGYGLKKSLKAAVKNTEKGKVATVFGYMAINGLLQERFAKNAK